VPTFREAQTGLWAKYDPLELATPEAFARDPELVWRWYTLVTQNVDSMHQRAGSRDVIEFHGNIFTNRCFADGHIVEIAGCDGVPTCPDCGAYVRPGVVWFGEAIPEEALHASFAAAADCDVFLSVGTSSLVYPAAGLGDVAREAGAVAIEVNPNPTGQSESFTASLRGNAGVVLPKLVESLAH
jgi:NAD-dependent deacetylase